ncbi:MAG: YidC/Oxa1 family membrane protein insertase [Pseudohongiellaceae bacterium]
MLYTLTLYPIELVLEVFLVILAGVTNSYFFGIVLLAILVRLATRPLETLTVKAVSNQAEIETVLKPQLAQIKHQLAGAARHEATIRLYKRYSYHPVFAVRSLLGVLVQLPFFIAAFYMLSGFERLADASIPLFGNLASPDSVLPGGLHLAPLLMTLINVLALYTRSRSSRREKIQGLVLAALFLVLLYESPLGLVLYWTTNNCVSLVTNFFPNLLSKFTGRISLPKVRGGVAGRVFEDYGYLFLVSNLALSLPLLGVLGAQFNLFTAHGMNARAILVLLLLLLFLPTVILGLLRWCSKKLSVSHIFDRVFLGLFLGIFLFYLFNKAGYGLLGSGYEPLVLFCLALAATVIITAVLISAKSLRTLAYFSLLIPVVFLHFIYVSPASTLFEESGNLDGMAPEGFNETPVYMLVFDEFSGLTLQDENSELDVLRYPEFAELAETADYFPNALTTGYHTDVAVPSIVSGTDRSGNRRGLAPGRNLIELFDSWGGGAFAHSAVLPADLVSKQTVEKGAVWSDLLTLYLHIISHQDWIESKIGVIPSTWKDFGIFHDHSNETMPELRASSSAYPARLGFFGDWLNSIESNTNREQFNFIHMVFPHVPYDFTAKGNLQKNSDLIRQQLTSVEAFQAGQSFLNVGYHNYMQQSAYAASLLQDFVTVLKEKGEFERSLVIVTADHGVSYMEEGQSRRDPFTPDAWKNIVSVPLFIKHPYQTEGRVDSSYVTTLDIAPTIMDAVEIDSPWALMGESVRDENRGSVSKSVNLIPGFAEFFDDIETLFSDSLARKKQLFGSNTPIADVAVNYSEQPLYQPLLNVPVSNYEAQPSEKTVVWGGSLHARELSNFGRVFDGGTPRNELTVAAAVGGVIQAVFKTGKVGEENGHFAFSLPEPETRPTQFNVKLYEVLVDEGFVLKEIRAFSPEQLRFQSMSVVDYQWQTAVVRTNGIDSLDVNNGRMTIRSSESNDPFIVLQAISDQPLRSPTIRLNLESNKDILLQVFYQTAEESGFAESRSQTYPINAGVNEAFIQLPEINMTGEFRVDLGFGDETEVNLLGIEIREEEVAQ